MSRKLPTKRPENQPALSTFFARTTASAPAPVAPAPDSAAATALSSSSSSSSSAPSAPEPPPSASEETATARKPRDAQRTLDGHVSSPVVYVAIIGTRADTSCDADAFDKMCTAVQNTLVQKCGIADLSTVHVLCGGCSGPDHVGVRLKLRGIVGGASLHLPCSLETVRRSYVDRDGKPRTSESPAFVSRTGKQCARTLNDLHAEFSSHRGGSTMRELMELKATSGVTVTEYADFAPRNLGMMRKAGILIAIVRRRDPDTGGPPAGTGARGNNGGTYFSWEAFDPSKPRFCLDYASMGIPVPMGMDGVDARLRPNASEPSAAASAPHLAGLSLVPRSVAPERAAGGAGGAGGGWGSLGMEE